MSAGITVRGGAHGLAVCLEELEGAARVLGSVERDLEETSLVLGAVASDPALALAGIIAPVESAQAEGAALMCAAVAVGLVARVGATAAVTSAGVDAYRSGERTAESLFDTAATSVGAMFGVIAPPVAAGVAGAVIGAAAVGLALGSSVDGVIPLERQLAWARSAALALALGLGQGMDEVLRDHPWLVTGGADGLDGILVGLGVGTPLLGVLMAERARRAGWRYPPRTHAEALDVVLALTRGVALDESRHDVRVRALEPQRGRAPSSVADLVSPTGPTDGDGRVRLVGVHHDDGSWTWVVRVPGTQTFTPRAGANPWDLTSDVLTSAGEQTLAMQAVSRALTDAQTRTGSRGRSRVLLTGHSLGGITVAALAADPDFRRRFAVTHVVTAGAPIARVAVPQDVSVLSLEHSEDLVPNLDGEDNPDRASWVTVEREVADALGPEGGASDAHAVDRYAQTAGLVDDSRDPSLVVWREGAAEFLDDEGREAVVIDYDIERVPSSERRTVAGSHP